MRVLLVYDLASLTDGAGKQVAYLRDLLRARGHIVRVFTSRVSLMPGPSQADASCFGTTHGRLQVLTQTANPDAVRVFQQELRTFQPDVVHIRMFLYQLSPLILALLSDVPTVYHMCMYKAVCPVGTKLLPDGTPCTDPYGWACLRHGCTTPQTWAASMVQLHLVQHWKHNINALVTLSHVAASRARELGLGEPEVIHNYVHPRAARPPLSRPPLAVFAGRLVRDKGVDVLLRAWARVLPHVPDARLIIAGDGPARAALEHLSADLHVAHTVTFTGYITDAMMEDLFARAWVQTVPSVWEEPFGNAATEAMARGTAVIVTDNGGHAEVVRHARDGLHVPPGNVEALADGLITLLTNRPLAEQYGASARAHVRATLGADRFMARIGSLYKRITGRDDDSA